MHIPLLDRSSTRSGEQSAPARTSPDTEVAITVNPQKPSIAIAPDVVATRAEPFSPAICTRPLEVRTSTCTLSGIAIR